MRPARHPSPLPDALTRLERTVVMGVVNVTPDSFSDGGQWFEPDEAIDHGRQLLRQGADLIDVGGESTRPGAGRIPRAEELRRVLPVIEELAGEAPISIDTTRADVAARALEAGACMVNDVSGGLADPAMAELIAGTGVVYVAMHWRAHSAVMDRLDVYNDVVADVRAELYRRVESLIAAGVGEQQIVLDPGLGFAKRGANNWPLLANLDELMELGFPVLIGASRKRFLGHLLGGADGPVPPLERDRATDAISTLAAAAGVWGVRVHETTGSADAVRVAAAWMAASPAAAPNRIEELQ